MKSFVFISTLIGSEEFNKKNNQVFLFLHNLEVEYRGFSTWYWNKVVPSVLLRSKEIIIAEFCGKIIGVAIIKNDKTEKKICTLRVKKEFMGQGIGRRLMECAFYELDTNMPFITVSSLRIVQFKKIFKYYGFKPSGLYANYYNSGKTEICFNGCLPGEIYLPTCGETKEVLSRHTQCFVRI